LGKATTQNRSLSTNKGKVGKDAKGDAPAGREEIKNIAKNLFDSEKKSDTNLERR
jgi:hypothetical protein